MAALQEVGADVQFVPAIDGEEVLKSTHAPSLAAWWEQDQQSLTETQQRWVDYFPDEVLPMSELKRFYGRPVNAGELGIFLSHRRCWEVAAGAPWSLVLEDDAVPLSFLPPATAAACCSDDDDDDEEGSDLGEEAAAAFFQLCSRRWTSVWSALTSAIEGLRERQEPWDILLLGRHRFGQDRDLEGDMDLVEAGFSTCLHAYAVSAQGAQKLLGLTALQAHAKAEDSQLDDVVPIDDLLPALWSGQHPRADLERRSKRRLQEDPQRRVGGRETRLRVLSFREDLVWQAESLHAVDGAELARVFRRLMASDIDSNGPWSSLSHAMCDPSQKASRWEALGREEEGLTLLRCSLFFGASDFAALAAVSCGLGRVLQNALLWRTFALSLLPSQDEEAPILSKFPGSWRGVALRAAGASFEALEEEHAASKNASASGHSSLVEANADLAFLRDSFVDCPVTEVQSVRKIPLSKLASSAFRRQHEVLPGVPVVLSDASSAISPKKGEGWNIQELVSSIGEKLCHCHLQDDAEAAAAGRPAVPVLQMPFKEYLAYMRSSLDVEPLYLFQEFDDEFRIAIDEHFRPPPHFDEDFLVEMESPPPNFAGLRGWILVGPPMSGSRWHFDPWGTAAWNLLFQGLKLWCFAPPTSSDSKPPRGVSTAALRAELAGENDFLGTTDKSNATSRSCARAGPRVFYAAPPALENLATCARDREAGLFWVLQKPGDLVFVPSGWWHSTVSLTETSAYTRNYINEHNYARAMEALNILHPNVANQLERWIWRLHADSDSEDEGPPPPKLPPAKPCESKIRDKTVSKPRSTSRSRSRSRSRRSSTLTS